MRLFTLFAILLLLPLLSFAQVSDVSNTIFKINGTSYEMGSLGLSTDQASSLQEILQNQQKMESYSGEYERIMDEVLNENKTKIKTNMDIASKLQQPSTLNTRMERERYFDVLTVEVIKLQKQTAGLMEKINASASQNQKLAKVIKAIQTSDANHNRIRILRN